MNGHLRVRLLIDVMVDPGDIPDVACLIGEQPIVRLDWGVACQGAGGKALPAGRFVGATEVEGFGANAHEPMPTDAYGTPV
jgi:hypothetical protein